MPDGLRIDFTEVEDQKEFTLVPNSRQAVTVTDWDKGEVQSPDAKNYGATKLTFELTIIGGDFEGRRIWDTFTLTQASAWKLKAFLGACGEDVTRAWDEDELVDVAPSLVGSELEVKVGTQPARKDASGDNEYPARNKIQAYYPAGGKNSKPDAKPGKKASANKLLP